MIKNEAYGVQRNSLGFRLGGFALIFEEASS